MNGDAGPRFRAFVSPRLVSTGLPQGSKVCRLKVGRISKYCRKHGAVEAPGLICGNSSRDQDYLFVTW